MATNDKINLMKGLATAFGIVAAIGPVILVLGTPAAAILALFIPFFEGLWILALIIGLVGSLICTPLALFVVIVALSSMWAEKNMTPEEREAMAMGAVAGHVISRM